MGYHGWQGNPPGTEDEARRRIVKAAMACVDRVGLAKTSMSVVASEAGVTRQTVYRYFPRLADILSAVALAGVEDFAARMARHLASFGSPAEVAVESVVFGVLEVPREPYLGLLLQAGESDFFTVAVTSPESFALGARILRDVPVDWAGAGIATDDELQGLAEILMRLFLSFLQHPSTPALTDDRLRALVRRWIGPALQ
ncbi:TetR/AcrR family transcriptional regulator [Lentzea flaviverrucosa]|uniref:Transcriptional regulator, TetR family n=1 Tax=Lentzea flaviverrucosa TaxID=200379 RepID=A0A1H9A9M9_9PSEU|nr:TetR/AcrR family transcriptional regulator [Lentzea flaviverrucosa]RDI32124.1 TetR family transcriptional regulator [Lentzea flaviverrucosa]SEP73442.1 transcriptional regulator, TetR family [Lentzea flaviverrucosa]